MNVSLWAFIVFASFFFESEKQLVWSDEFDSGDQPDSSNWELQIGNGCPDLCGWGNNELQFYTDKQENARIENGFLIIEAHKNDTSGFTSAKLVSKGAGWKYGRIEVKARLPKGTGTWPAVWMLPVDWSYGGWPNSGEIDIMEHVGYDQGKVHGTVHTESFNHSIGTQQGKYIELPDVSEGFHVYAIDWDEDGISFYVDDEKYNYFANTKNGYKEWPFDQPFNIILNIAVGGNWGGKEGVDPDIWPQQMVIDYVRVYQ